MDVGAGAELVLAILDVAPVDAAFVEDETVDGGFVEEAPELVTVEPGTAVPLTRSPVYVR